MEQTFFGLTPNDVEIFLEQAFILMYYLGFTYAGVRNLPLAYRRWFIDRVIKELERNAEQGNPSKHEPDPTTRLFAGMHRGQGPHRTKRQF